MERSIKAASKKGYYRVLYKNEPSTKHLPLYCIQASDPIAGIVALGELYGLLHQAIKGTDYVSLKYMMLQRYFPHIYNMIEIKGRLMDLKWFEFPLFLFLETSFEALPSFRFSMQQIDPEIVFALKLKSWISLLPGLQQLQQISADFEKTGLYLGHLKDLAYFDHNDSLDVQGSDMIQAHFQRIGKLLAESWNALIEALSEIFEGVSKKKDQQDLDELEYRSLLLDVLEGIIPEDGADEATRLDLISIVNWSEKMAKLTEHWGMFVLMHQKRLIEHFQEH